MKKRLVFLPALVIVFSFFLNTSVECGSHSPSSSVLDDMQTLVDGFFQDSRRRAGNVFDVLKDDFGPIRVVEDTKNKVYRIEVDLAGFDKNDIKIRFTKDSSGAGHLIVITASSRKSEKRETSSRKWTEKSALFATRSFEASRSIPSYLDIKKPEIHHDNGVVIIKLKFDDSHKENVMEFYIP